MFTDYGDVPSVANVLPASMNIWYDKNVSCKEENAARLLIERPIGWRRLLLESHRSFLSSPSRPSGEFLRRPSPRAIGCGLPAPHSRRTSYQTNRTAMVFGRQWSALSLVLDSSCPCIRPTNNALPVSRSQTRVGTFIAPLQPREPSEGVQLKRIYDFAPLIALILNGTLLLRNGNCR